jgi:hypothetical protein
MFDYTTEFDAAPAADGPWLHFYAKPSADGIPAGSWVLRDGANRSVIDLSRGIVIEWRAVRTGWIQSLGLPGVAPVKRWNPSRARFEPRPPGDGWSRGFHVPLAYAHDAAITWEQWGVGAWIGFAGLFQELLTTASAQLPALPLVIPIGAKSLKFAQGPSLYPLFKLSRYVQRPACLANDASAQPQISAQSQPRLQSGYAYSPPQAVRPQASAPAHPQVQPVGWDDPAPKSPAADADLAQPGTANMAGAAVPTPQKSAATPSDELTASDPWN